MANEAPKQMFDVTEETLRQLHLGCIEVAAESELKEHADNYVRQAKMIDAIGSWRFPNSWADGLPHDTKVAA